MSAVVGARAVVGTRAVVGAGCPSDDACGWHAARIGAISTGSVASMAALAAAAACAVGLLTTALATCRVVARPLAATMMGCSAAAAAGRCGERCDEERCGERDDWSSGGEERRTPLMVIGWGAFAGSAAALEMSELAACVIA